LVENVIVNVAGTDVKIQQVELASIIEARLEELMSYILGEMNKVNALTSSKKIVLTGRGARLNKVCDKFTNEFGLDTEIGKIKDVCYEKYSSYFAGLDSVDGNPDKTARKMNEFAACLGVLESCELDSCVYVGRKESAAKTVKKTEPGEKKRFSIWVSGLFGNMAETVAEKTGTIINGTEIK
jgi:cell division ATPase FtsA